jgi:gliding motility-associated-like protein
VGPTPINVEEGAYELTIKDSKGCITEPISFNFSNTIDPITVTETIIPLGCGLDNSDGAINISIAGGISPYSIKWDKEIPPVDNSSSPTYENIGNNLLAINNLASGRYRLTITSSFIACDNKAIRTLTKFYEMKSPETIKILEGPFLNKSLCLGEPGTIQIKLFDSNSDEFSFYYDTQLVTGIAIGNDFYEVIIDSPVEEGELIVINENGCGINIPIITGVGIPDFSYTSSSYVQSGVILANEDVIFNNTSQDQYLKMVWDFGDGSEVLEINSENEAATEITHKYITPGSFTVSLRFYNALGCFKEIIKQISIGKGFLVVFPSAFTPNGDTINDIFLAKFTGLKSFNFQIFDTLGNLIYTSKVESLPTDNSWGWDGNYVNGKEYNNKTFRYRFTGITLDDKEVNYIGEAVILK